MVRDIAEILDHWQRGRAIQAIARSPGLDRKTVRKYVALAEQAGFQPGRGPAGVARWHSSGRRIPEQEQTSRSAVAENQGRRPRAAVPGLGKRLGLLPPNLGLLEDTGLPMLANAPGTAERLHDFPLRRQVDRAEADGDQAQIALAATQPRRLQQGDLAGPGKAGGVLGEWLPLAEGLPEQPIGARESGDPRGGLGKDGVVLGHRGDGTGTGR